MSANKHFSGLTDSQVLQNRQKYGTNELTPPRKISLWKLYFEKFEDPVIRLLLFIAVLSLGISFVENDYTESIGIFLAIFLSTGVGFWFEYDAKKKFDILSIVNDETPYKVIRNGIITKVQKKDIVWNDEILIETGEEVPADGELLEAVSLQIDESTLTGEPVSQKSTDKSLNSNENTYPTFMVYRGTKVMDGHGIFRVTQVGDNTEFGKVARNATEITSEDTPLNKQLARLAKFIGVVGSFLAGLTFFVLFSKDLIIGINNFSNTQLGLIGIIIASLLFAFAKIWLPVILDLSELIGKELKISESIKKRTWSAWLVMGAGIFLILIILGGFAGIDVFDKNNWIDIKFAERILHYFMVSVTLIVVAVPEGLPMSVTLSLAMSMRRMLASNNLVRKMHATETMGATTVICTDKTGTLTENRMEVNEVIFDKFENKLSEDIKSRIIIESISVNSTAHLELDANGVKPLGNPTESALLIWLYKQGVNYLPVREVVNVIQQLTFSTERKFMASLVYSPEIGKTILYVKGAPEIILSLCKNTDIYYTESPKIISKTDIENTLSDYQEGAMRTLGFAYEIIEDNLPRIKDGLLINTDLIFLGVAAITDPVRSEVPKAVSDCLNAGINIKIVTGDNCRTARQIARQIGIWDENKGNSQIISGTDFTELSEEDALEKVNHINIMCRARPSDKQRLVQLLQKNNEIVAVTGDGTNDAPALNFAHVGLSMGSGTYVAKEASDITLIDDSFSSIANAVMWGRSIYENIQRFIMFQLTINVCALLIVLIGSIFGKDIPLTVTQMLWVNLIMDTFAAAALASLPPNSQVMKNKPRKNDAFIINPLMKKHILFAGISFVIIMLILLFILSTDGKLSRYDLSRYFTVFVMLQFWNMFNAKAFLTEKSAFANLRKSYGFIIIAGIILFGQFIIVEYGGDVFRTAPLALKDWLIILGSTSLVLWIGEINRFIKKIYFHGK